jgi:hypothetical protein
MGQINLSLPVHGVSLQRDSSQECPLSDLSRSDRGSRAVREDAALVARLTRLSFLPQTRIREGVR